MSDLKEALAQIKARAEKATEGPWEADGRGVFGARESWDEGIGPTLIASMQMPYRKERMELNAEFIAHARADVPRLVEAVEAVLKELDLQRDAASSLMERGESNRAAQIQWCEGLIRSALTDKLEGEPDE